MQGSLRSSIDRYAVIRELTAMRSYLNRFSEVLHLGMEAIAARLESSWAVLLLQELFHSRHVFRHVHADRIVFHFAHAHLPAVLQPTQLLEPFHALEIALRQRREFEQRLPLVDIQTQVLQVARMNAVVGV